MNAIDDIIIDNKPIRSDLADFMQKLVSSSPAKMLELYRELNGKNDELSILKLFALYLQRNNEILKEFKRTFAGKNSDIKVNFIISQFSSRNRDVILASIEIAGILKTPLVMPYLQNIRIKGDADICNRIIEVALGVDDDYSAKILRCTMTSGNITLAKRSLDALSKRINSVPWEAFKPLLSHSDREIRLAAAFAIALRRAKASARTIIKAIAAEKLRDARLVLIRYAGMIPSRSMLIRLLDISVHDDDMKARLAATRTIDRLQGVIEPEELYSLRSSSDEMIRAEVLFRIGKFGSFAPSHKRYLRDTLKNSRSPIIRHACIMAMGYISEHRDMEFLESFLEADPATSYNATLALTRIWRLGDENNILHILKESHSATQRQIILKYLTRRRGFGLSPEVLLRTAEGLLKDESCMNVKYLIVLLLKFSPILETFEFLFKIFSTHDCVFTMDAAGSSLTSLSNDHPDLLLEYFRKSDIDTCNQLISFIPRDLTVDFARKLLAAIFDKIEDPNISRKFEDIYLTFTSRHEIARQILRSLPDIVWKRLFLKNLLKYSSLPLIRFVRGELLALLGEDDDEVKMLAMRLLALTGDISTAPYLVAASEALNTSEAKEVASSFIKAHGMEVRP